MEIPEIHSNEKYLFKNWRHSHQTDKIQYCKAWISERWMLEGILMLCPRVGCYGIRIQQLVYIIWILSYGITQEGQLQEK